MNSGDGKQLLENTPRPETPRLPVEAAPPEAPKQPVGTVERVLNFRDRNLLIGACRQFCDKDKNGDHKAQSKLDRVSKLLNLDETVEYFNMIDDSVEDATFRWMKERNDYLAWMQYSSGGATLEELKKRAPNVDPSIKPKKPPKATPQATPAEMRGKERSFYIPSKLDAWIQDVLKVSTFQAMTAEYVTELCSKFGLKEED